MQAATRWCTYSRAFLPSRPSGRSPWPGTPPASGLDARLPSEPTTELGRLWAVAGYGGVRPDAPRAARLADGVITATEEEARYFRRLGVRRVETIAPAVDKTTHVRREQSGPGVRAKFGLRDEPTVLLVARPDSSRRKGCRSRAPHSGRCAAAYRTRGSCCSATNLSDELAA